MNIKYKIKYSTDGFFWLCSNQAMKTYHVYHNESKQAELKLKYIESQKLKVEQHASKGTASKKFKSFEKQTEKVGQIVTWPLWEYDWCPSAIMLIYKTLDIEYVKKWSCSLTIHKELMYKIYIHPVWTMLIIFQGCPVVALLHQCMTEASKHVTGQIDIFFRV